MLLLAGTLSLAASVTPSRIVFELVDTRPAVPRSCSRPPRIVTAPIVVGCGARNASVPPVIVTSPFRAMLLPACNVSVLLPAQVSGALSVMVWVAPLVEFSVEIVTLELLSWEPSQPVLNVSSAVEGLASPATIVTEPGSSSRVPAWPRAEDRSAEPVIPRCCLPETSAKPPLPPAAPPLASIAPAKRVVSSLQTITVPPAPTLPASARSRAPESTVVSVALRTSGFAPMYPPPTITLPPSVAPETSMLLVATRFTVSPVTRTSPPAPVVPTASTRPATMVAPADSIRTVPPVSPLAMVWLPAPSWTLLDARKTTVPLASTDAPVALTVPSLRMAPA